MGALVDGPEPDELADFGSALLPGGRAFRRNGLFVADGGIRLPRRSLLCRGVRCAVRGCRVFFEVCPGFPWGSLVFLFVPSGRVLGGWSGTQATEARRLRRS